MKKIIFCLSLLTGCKQDPPVTHLYIIDVQHNVCSERVITDKRTLKSEFVQDLPLWQCDGNVSLTMQEFLNLRTWLKDK